MSKKFNPLLKNTIIREELDYQRINPKILFAGDKLSRPEKKTTRDVVLIFDTGLLFILSAMRSKFKDALFNVSLRFLMQHLKRQQHFSKFLPNIQTGSYGDDHSSSAHDNSSQTHATEVKNIIAKQQTTMNKSRKKVAITGDLVDSLGESMIVSILDRLGIAFQVGMYFYDQRMNLDFYLKDHDIYVEFWGMENNPNYNQRRTQKEAKIKELGLEVISIESYEVNNAPKLEQRLKTLLNLEPS